MTIVDVDSTIVDVLAHPGSLPCSLGGALDASLKVSDKAKKCDACPETSCCFWVFAINYLYVYSGPPPPSVLLDLNELI